MMLDSGSISAISRGDLEWLKKTDYVAYLTRNYPFDIVANIDLPIMALKKSKNKMNSKKAININNKNIEEFLAKDITAKKLLVLQGNSISDYMNILYHIYKIGALSDTEKHIIGIGSLVGRNWNESVEIIRILMEEVPAGIWVHAFGVGSYRRLSDLIRLSVRSTDTALASRTSSFGKVVYPGGNMKMPKSKNFHQGVIMPINMATITYKIPLVHDNWGGLRDA
jgi:queuine/archaeosine tRNA-ribosyltransferase